MDKAIKIDEGLYRQLKERAKIERRTIKEVHTFILRNFFIAKKQIKKGYENEKSI